MKNDIFAEKKHPETRFSLEISNFTLLGKNPVSGNDYPKSKEEKSPHS